MIHISGFPGSGKSTLGEKIKKFYEHVYDTDEFIQHHTEEGKELLELQNQIKEGKKTKADYKAAWQSIISKKIEEIKRSKGDKIILIGSLDNFAPHKTIYDPQAKYKFMLTLPLEELMKRYYSRLAKQDLDYWVNVSKCTYNIIGSEDFIKDYQWYVEWHKKKEYQQLSDKEIIAQVKKILT